MDKSGFQWLAAITAGLKEASVFTIAIRLTKAIRAPGQKCTKVRLEPARPFAMKDIGTVWKDEIYKKFS